MKSIAHRTYIWLSSKPPGAIVNITHVRKQFTEGTESDGATTAMSDMVKAAVLERVGRGTYKVLPSLDDWGKNKTWVKRGKSKKQTKVINNYRGVDVIEELLTAMANAAPELERLRKQDKLLQQAREL